uniref:Uncharacterized protein n=1 Tax=Rhizophora mucronata TaxID=61149 RepID=A0A2P2IS40_RHIMU
MRPFSTYMYISDFCKLGFVQLLAQRVPEIPYKCFTFDRQRVLRCPVNPDFGDSFIHVVPNPTLLLDLLVTVGNSIQGKASSSVTQRSSCHFNRNSIIKQRYR